MVRVFPACVFQPKCLLLFIVLVIFLIFAFTNPKQVPLFVKVCSFFSTLVFLRIIWIQTCGFCLIFCDLGLVVEFDFYCFVSGCCEFIEN